MTDYEQIPVGDSTVPAHFAGPSDARAGVVVLHAWWGLNDDVIGYADRLAREGYAVLAPDMFGGKIATTVEEAEGLTSEGDAVAGDIAMAAVDTLAERVGPDGRLGILGFSFGAAYAILTPSERDRVSASVAYYGTYWGDFLAKSKAAFLGHFAENDPYEPAESVDSLEKAMTDAGRKAEFHRYPGTGHWFAEPSRPDAYDRAAAELAYDRTVAFLDRELRPGR
jgi:carboxymethylenebutenolidase